MENRMLMRGPGDVINVYGDICIDETHAMTVGVIVVTAAQAEAAKAHGWEVVKDHQEQHGLVQIRRTHANAWRAEQP